MTANQLIFGEPLFTRISRERKATDPRVRPMVAAFYEHLHMKCLTWTVEGNHAKAILAAGFTSEQVNACYDYLLTDSFWKDKDITLITIRKKIAWWVKRGRPAVAVQADGAQRDKRAAKLRRFEAMEKEWRGEAEHGYE